MVLMKMFVQCKECKHWVKEIGKSTGTCGMYGKTELISIWCEDTYGNSALETDSEFGCILGELK